MNIQTAGIFIYEVIKGTPFYVWILFAYLVSKGRNAVNVRKLSLQKMLIMPAVFAVWGLDKMFTRFSSLGYDLMGYFLFLVMGALAGYLLYSRTRKVFCQDGIYYQTGSWLPLGIILINFSIKYILGVLVAIQPQLYNAAGFCMGYSALSGLSVGLFAGGCLQAYTAYLGCENKGVNEAF